MIDQSLEYFVHVNGFLDDLIIIRQILPRRKCSYEVPKKWNDKGEIPSIILHDKREPH